MLDLTTYIRRHLDRMMSIFDSIMQLSKPFENPNLTFFGIAKGIVIMALAFGPGLFFLFRRRFEQMKPAGKRKNHQVLN